MTALWAMWRCFTGSDHAMLDDAVVAMLRGSHGPPFTAGMAGDRIAVTVPTTFAPTR